MQKKLEPDPHVSCPGDVAFPRGDFPCEQTLSYGLLEVTDQSQNGAGTSCSQAESPRSRSGG